MELPLHFLGAFSRLPIELRLIIWEYLISSIHTGSVPKDNPLSIICASRYLHKEILSHIFNKSIQIISLRPYYWREWMNVRLKSRTIDVKWTFRNRADSERHFQNFPHSKTTMAVCISSPDPTDPGQVVLLWQKVNTLVDLVIPFARPEIELVLTGPWHLREVPAHWRANRSLFKEMGSLQESIKPLYICRPDKDIVTLPFLRLELWDKDPVTNVPAMSDDQFDSLHRDMMDLFNKPGIELRLGYIYTMTQATAASRIENALNETNLFLETSLDEMPGRTADFLRLTRYQNWFRDGMIWQSAYETRLQGQLHTSPWVIAWTDPWLLQLYRRRMVLILLYHALNALKSSSFDGLGIFHKVVYTKWDSKMWSDMFPTGIPPLSNVQDWLSRFWSDKSQLRTFHAYSHWLRLSRAGKNGANKSGCPTMDHLSVWSC